jgi:hypothetical protein
MTGGGYGYGSRGDARGQSRSGEIILLVRLEKLQPCSPATCVHNSYPYPLLCLTHTLIHACTHAAAEPDDLATEAIGRVFLTRDEVHRGSVVCTVWGPGSRR